MILNNNKIFILIFLYKYNYIILKITYYSKLIQILNKHKDYKKSKK